MRKIWALDKASLTKLATVKPELQKVALYAAAICPLPFAVTSGNRTQKEQDYLYAQGRSRPGPKITQTRRSKHIGGGALDFTALDSKGKPDWKNLKPYPEIARSFKIAAAKLGVIIEWGGDWKWRDMGHIQYMGRRTPKASSAPMQTLMAPPPAPVSVEGTGISYVTEGTPKLVEGTPQWAVRYLMVLGWPRVAAIALVANIMWESGGHQQWSITWGAHGDRGADGLYHSHTALQLNDKHGRWQSYESYARDRGKAWDDPVTILDWLDKEMASTEHNVKVQLGLARTLGEAMKAAIGYWRPGKPHAARRNEIAVKLEKEIGR